MSNKRSSDANLAVGKRYKPLDNYVRMPDKPTANHIAVVINNGWGGFKITAHAIRWMRDYLRSNPSLLEKYNSEMSDEENSLFAELGNIHFWRSELDQHHELYKMALREKQLTNSEWPSEIEISYRCVRKFLKQPGVEARMRSETPELHKSIASRIEDAWRLRSPYGIARHHWLLQAAVEALGVKRVVPDGKAYYIPLQFFHNNKAFYHIEEYDGMERLHLHGSAACMSLIKLLPRDSHFADKVQTIMQLSLHDGVATSKGDFGFPDDVVE
eukprot:TRINITY_DN7355_c0_g2_i1.p1 TRINITY_DN7355_c0_g2~~TRINITY_DN7355_c0_g2_i1.p1  ORF type:complete len:271 (+),score=23.17 TRINITY_DN7355_c0_g2_i1:347-1159(+)